MSSQAQLISLQRISYAIFIGHCWNDADFWLSLDARDANDARSETCGTGPISKIADILQLKCSRTVPCTSCTKATETCEYGAGDGRKLQASKHYVASLEREVATLKDALRQARSSKAVCEDTVLADEPPTIGLSVDTSSRATQVLESMTWRKIRNGNLLLNASSRVYSSYQGPTSIYRLGENSETESLNLDENDETPSLYQTISAEDTDVNEILRSFFRWQYHQYMFLYREALLLDYLNHEYGGRYCSLTLIYAICALGHVAEGRQRGDMSRFLEKAYAELYESDVFSVSLTTVQALLCLAFCELALGNIPKAWLLSGESSVSRLLRMTRTRYV